MKHVLRFFLLIVVVGSVFAFTAAHPASAQGCANIVFDVTGPGSGIYSIIQGHTYRVDTYAGGVLTPGIPFVAKSTVSIPMPVPAGWRMTLTELGLTCGGPAVTWFTPGDGRVAPKPGDRVAVYCNTSAKPPALDVWGVTNDGKGQRLFTFTYADLVAAGNAGISKAVEPMGTVVAFTDGKGSFSVQWFGGPFGATGKKDFAKSFTCNFPK